jgi:hypothetical protein
MSWFIQTSLPSPVSISILSRLDTSPSAISTANLILFSMKTVVKHRRFLLKWKFSMKFKFSFSLSFASLRRLIPERKKMYSGGVCSEQICLHTFLLCRFPLTLLRSAFIASFFPMKLNLLCSSSSRIMLCSQLRAHSRDGNLQFLLEYLKRLVISEQAAAAELVGA